MYTQYSVANKSNLRLAMTWQMVWLLSGQHGSHSQGNIIFQDFSRIKLPFSRTKYTLFKGNKSRYVWRNIAYLFNVWSIIDMFYGTTSSSPLLAVRSTHVYLNFSFLLQSKFSSTSIIFIHRIFCSQAIFFPGYFLVLWNSRTLPGNNLNKAK